MLLTIQLLCFGYNYYEKKFDRDQDCKFSNFNGVIFFVKFVNENVFNMNNDISVMNCFNVIK